MDIAGLMGFDFGGGGITTPPATNSGGSGTTFNGMGGFTIPEPPPPAPEVGDDDIDDGENVVARSSVSAPFKMDNADIEFVGPIDIL